MSELKLPAPCLVVLVGPSGTGKTTWAQQTFSPNEVVSSDALRAMAGIAEDDQAASSAAFRLLEEILAERLSRRLTTVIDTTGLNPDDRGRWVDKARQADIPAYAILFSETFETSVSRTSQNPRPIPRTILKKQFANMAKTRGAIESEGFAGVFEEQPAGTVAPSVLTDSPPPSPRSASHGFGLLLSRFSWGGDAPLGSQLTEIAQRAEEAGFSDIWLMDHFRQIRGVGRHWEDIPEAYIGLSHIAAATNRVRVGSLVSGITHRNPVVLGKMVATLDVLSGGRAICGLGAAWDEAEHKAYGIDFPPLSERYDRLEDTLQLLPLLWGKGSPSFEGKTIKASELICYPRPTQDSIPLMVGGGGERRTLRLVAKYADMANVFGDPSAVQHKVEVLNRHCEEIDRDPDEIEVSHLTTAMVAADRGELRSRIETIRGRNTSAEEFADRSNAGTIGDLIDFFTRFDAAGAGHSIVALPDVDLEGSIEAFADVITAFA